MGETLQTARRLLETRPALASFEVHRQGDELHLVKEGESFVRLVPLGGSGRWRMEYFYNLERWEVIDFSGSLEECLDYLIGAPHYRFWEG
jgi:hypothetical protein